ncbi:MAG: glycerate kinase, partial [Oscillospiraceae bacterium]|nr:glycerate kinase [Oscillospiraceae bacterium]
MSLRDDANVIIQRAISASLPDEAVKKALKELEMPRGKLVTVAIGKAAWQMARAAADILGDRITDGVVITKYGHSKGNIGNMRVFEAGHPVPDANSYAATQSAIELVKALGEQDTVLFLVSGGGSALFEKPLCSEETLDSVTRQLLACGADITEMNIIRKRLSAVKGGKFAQLCAPAKVFSVVLSDVLGDRLDTIASGPAYPDSSTCGQALEIVKKYSLELPPQALELLERESPKELSNVETHITGSVRELCEAARQASEELGYESVIITDSLSCEAAEAGSFLAAIARYYQNSEKSFAFIAGGETVVHLKGEGLGGRNQEIALSAALGIDRLKATAVFSVGSDGTDGPTDAAGGYADGETVGILRDIGIDAGDYLAENDSYHALEKCGGLIVTGATGTNVN